MKEVRTLYVDKGEDGVRVDRGFKRRWPHLNHIQLNKLFRSGQVRVDGSRVKADTKLAAGSQVRVPPLPDAPDPDEKLALSKRDIAFAKSLVLYEDEEVLALNKPAGLAVVALLDHQRGLQRKGRKGGEAAHHADTEQDPPVFLLRAAPQGQPGGQKPHQQPARQIDDEGAVGPV